MRDAVICSILALACSAPSDPDAGSMRDAGFDAAMRDAGKEAGLDPEDAGSIDAGSIDAGSIDASNTDASMIDASTIDAGMVDAGPFDGGGFTCTGACNEVERSREPRECFNETEAADLDYLRSIAMANGTMCPDGRTILGFRLYSSGGCIRMDRYYCEG